MLSINFPPVFQFNFLAGFCLLALLCRGRLRPEAGLLTWRLPSIEIQFYLWPAVGRPHRLSAARRWLKNRAGGNGGPTQNGRFKISKNFSFTPKLNKTSKYVRLSYWSPSKPGWILRTDTIKNMAFNSTVPRRFWKLPLGLLFVKEIDLWSG